MTIGALNPLDDTSFAAQTTSFTGTAGTVTGWPTGPQAVLVWVDSPAYIKVGTGVTATSASTPIPAYTPVPFKVPVGATGTFTVSAIQISAGGNVYAKPINFN